MCPSRSTRSTVPDRVAPPRPSRWLADRREAGRALAERLVAFAGRADVRVLTLTPGGAVVGEAVAGALRVPMEAVAVRTLTVPGRPELVMGAIACEDVRVLDAAALLEHHVSDAALEAATTVQTIALVRRHHRLHDGGSCPEVAGGTAIVVDDGRAGGCALRAAILCVLRRAPLRVIAALPAADASLVAELRTLADEVVVLDALDALGVFDATDRAPDDRA